ncbi:MULTISPECIES: bacteriocin [Staphylococcus]|jgi:bacteriocin-like protein|nr:MULTISPECIES: bacteriocin [Staphylococcus]MBC3103983.1 bacteriocin [Staphylococcus haemolyticus]MBC3106376.1 bacteriocin [Staphylococcus haemolyticus]MBC3144839.1 bacteriocin [Staphylococcus haemolyticus]MBE7297187.1 bacteriocin [Staphylococcus haemolyticus]MCH4335390.1 bacteriocin [Staphylococcus haemolyticus]
MKTLNITELKKINGGEVNDARRNGEKTGNFARETKNFIKDIGEAISPFK